MGEVAVKVRHLAAERQRARGQEHTTQKRMQTVSVCSELTRSDDLGSGLDCG
jgi:hypothetical protein